MASTFSPIRGVITVITDPRRLRRVLEVMTDSATTNEVCARASAAMEDIKKIPPKVGIEEIRGRLRELVEANPIWDADNDIEARSELKRIANQLDRFRKIKRGGIASFPPAIKTQLEHLTGMLMIAGVFLVPVGELEEWLADSGIVESRENKWAWANAAALQIQTRGADNGDIRDFARSVGHYLVLQSPSPIDARNTTETAIPLPPIVDATIVRQSALSRPEPNRVESALISTPICSERHD